MNITGMLTSNRKFEAKLEGQSQSFHACEERSTVNREFTNVRRGQLVMLVMLKCIIVLIV